MIYFHRRLFEHWDISDDSFKYITIGFTNPYGDYFNICYPKTLLTLWLLKLLCDSEPEMVKPIPDIFEFIKKNEIHKYTIHNERYVDDVSGTIEECPYLWGK